LCGIGRFQAEQSTESAASTSATSGARSLASSRSFGRRTSEKFFNIAVAGLAKAQVNEQKAVNGKGRRKVTTVTYKQIVLWAIHRKYIVRRMIEIICLKNSIVTL
jgi:hypothetical protein